MGLAAAFGLAGFGAGLSAAAMLVLPRPPDHPAVFRAPWHPLPVIVFLLLVVVMVALFAVGITLEQATVRPGAKVSGKIKVTPQFTKMVVGATIGFFVLIMVNLVAGFFTDGGLGLREGPLGIVVGLFAIGLASMNLVLDFDLVEKGARAGLPTKYGWFAAFGIMVTLVWLYIEILRRHHEAAPRDGVTVNPPPRGAIWTSPPPCVRARRSIPSRKRAQIASSIGVFGCAAAGSPRRRRTPSGPAPLGLPSPPSPYRSCSATSHSYPR